MEDQGRSEKPTSAERKNNFLMKTLEETETPVNPFLGKVREH